jgi:hypothetical protein
VLGDLAAGPGGEDMHVRVRFGNIHPISGLVAPFIEQIYVKTAR